MKLFFRIVVMLLVLRACHEDGRIDRLEERLDNIKYNQNCKYENIHLHEIKRLAY